MQTVLLDIAVRLQCDGHPAPVSREDAKRQFEEMVGDEGHHHRAKRLLSQRLGKLVKRKILEDPDGVLAILSAWSTWESGWPVHHPVQQQQQPVAVAAVTGPISSEPISSEPAAPHSQDQSGPDDESEDDLGGDLGDDLGDDLRPDDMRPPEAIHDMRPPEAIHESGFMDHFVVVPSHRRVTTEATIERVARVQPESESDSEDDLFGPTENRGTLCDDGIRRYRTSNNVWRRFPSPRGVRVAPIRKRGDDRRLHDYAIEAKDDEKNVRRKCQGVPGEIESLCRALDKTYDNERFLRRGITLSKPVMVEKVVVVGCPAFIGSLDDVVREIKAFSLGLLDSDGNRALKLLAIGVTNKEALSNIITGEKTSRERAATGETALVPYRYDKRIFLPIDQTTFKFLYDDDFTYEGDTPLAIMERAIQKLEIRGNLTSSGGNKRLMSAKPTKVRSERAGWLAESQQELPSNVITKIFIARLEVQGARAGTFEKALQEALNPPLETSYGGAKEGKSYVVFVDIHSANSFHSKLVAKIDPANRKQRQHVPIAW